MKWLLSRIEPAFFIQIYIPQIKFVLTQIHFTRTDIYCPMHILLGGRDGYGNCFLPLLPNSPHNINTYQHSLNVPPLRRPTVQPPLFFLNRASALKKLQQPKIAVPDLNHQNMMMELVNRNLLVILTRHMNTQKTLVSTKSVIKS